MNLARILVLAVALLAGGIAAWLVGGRPAATTVPVVVEAPSTEVLVAARNIGLGQVVVADDLAWRKWPPDAVEGFIARSANAGALEANVGSVARMPVAVGEPITGTKLVKKEGAGVLSVLLSAGMRAVALEIDAEKGAGGFILPNDRVDVLLTRREGAAGQAGGGAEAFDTSTILQNVRVLAIDQAIAEKDGQQVVVGRTATLELLPAQTETLAAARQAGTLSLALRPLVDASASGDGPQSGAARPAAPKAPNVIRFGVQQNAL
jgi:pilus assembly protein CpaB